MFNGFYHLNLLLQIFFLLFLNVNMCYANNNFVFNKMINTVVESFYGIYLYRYKKI